MTKAGPDTDWLTCTLRRNGLASRSCLLLLFLLPLACAEPLFPPAMLKGVDFTSEFVLSTSEVDTHMKGRIVLIGGRMVALQQQSGRLQIMAHELRFEKDPLLGRLVETGAPLGTIAIDYPANIEHRALERGNKFLAIGRVQGTTNMTIEGMPRVIPLLRARCLHIWRTGWDSIGEYPHLPTGYYPLRHDVYCVPTQS